MADKINSSERIFGKNQKLRHIFVTTVQIAHGFSPLLLIQKIAVGTSVVAVLPWKAAVVLVALATVLTILGGFIPAKTASRSDPVKALRAE